MRPNAYRILDEAVERGVVVGWDRAHKHTDEPDSEHLCDAIYNAIMSEICEYFEFPECT